MSNFKENYHLIRVRTIMVKALMDDIATIADTGRSKLYINMYTKEDVQDAIYYLEAFEPEGIYYQNHKFIINEVLDEIANDSKFSEESLNIQDIYELIENVVREYNLLGDHYVNPR